MEAQKEIYRSDVYANFLEEKKKFISNYEKYTLNLKKYSPEIKVLYKKILFSLEFDSFDETEIILSKYKKEIMKILKLHNDMVDEIIYSRYFLLMAKIEGKQKANIEKRRFINKLHEAIKTHKEQLNYINDLVK